MKRIINSFENLVEASSKHKKARSAYLNSKKEFAIKSLRFKRLIDKGYEKGFISARDCTIMIHKWASGKLRTYEDTAREFDVTRERIRQIERASLKRISNSR